MSTQRLQELLDQYRAGLDAEITLLRRLEVVAARQHELSALNNVADFNVVADQRDRLMAGLVNVEQELRSLRQTLGEAREAVQSLPGFEEAVQLHRLAVALMTKIMERDSETLSALAIAEQARRDAVRALEKGETTLEAYRRMAARPPAATLVNRRG